MVATMHMTDERDNRAHGRGIRADDERPGGDPASAPGRSEKPGAQCAGCVERIDDSGDALRRCPGAPFASAVRPACYTPDPEYIPPLSDAAVETVPGPLGQKKGPGIAADPAGPLLPAGQHGPGPTVPLRRSAPGPLFDPEDPEDPGDPGTADPGRQREARPTASEGASPSEKNRDGEAPPNLAVLCPGRRVHPRPCAPGPDFCVCLVASHDTALYGDGPTATGGKTGGQDPTGGNATATGGKNGKNACTSAGDGTGNGTHVTTGPTTRGPEGETATAGARAKKDPAWSRSHDGAPGNWPR